MKSLTLTALLILAGCATEPREYVCFNPLDGGAARVDVPAPNVVDSRSSLQITAEDGAVISVPKSLCIQIRKAQ